MSIATVRAGHLYAWRGPSLVIVRQDGTCAADAPISGFYHREARFLSLLRVTANGEVPWLCESAAVAPDLIAFTFVHPEITTPGGGGTGQADDEVRTHATGLPERGLNLRLTHRVRVAALETTLEVTNRATTVVEVHVRCALDADFADLLEAQSRTREQQGPVSRRQDDGRLEFAYGHPYLALRSEVQFSAPWTCDPEGLTAALTLAPRESIALRFDVVPRDPDETAVITDAAAREAAARAWATAFTRIDVPGNTAVERILTANAGDVASFPQLTGPRDEWLALQAGMPLYPAFFGRDALTAGWQAALLDQGAALDAALTRLGRLQSDRDDEWRDEEPGRIPYQVRSGPLARLGVNPYSAYYADYASPLMFVIALANLFAWTGDRARLRAHWDAARRILDWARERGDLDGDGYLEYRTRSRKGTKNQGWKDSGDAIVYDDGRPVPPPIATCELQGYWYAAQELMSLLCLFMDATTDAAAYRQSAAELKRRFNRDWWSTEENCIALALDPDKRRVTAPTSNAGHCLATGIVDRAHLPALVGRLFAPDMFSGWGIRTLSSAHAYYDPLSYHRGSVWAVEQATIVFGLRRFGFDARALELARAQFDLAALYAGFRIPECVGGTSRRDGATPGAYPQANTPQLWNATAFPLIVQSMLGLLPLAQLGTLVVDPLLPEWMPEVVLHGLRIGRARVSLRFRRQAGGRTDWDALHSRGGLRVVRQPPPESLTAGPSDRARAWLDTLTHLAGRGPRTR